MECGVLKWYKLGNILHVVMGKGCWVHENSLDIWVSTIFGVGKVDKGSNAPGLPLLVLREGVTSAVLVGLYVRSNWRRCDVRQMTKSLSLLTSLALVCEIFLQISFWKPPPSNHYLRCWECWKVYIYMYIWNDLNYICIYKIYYVYVYLYIYIYN